MEPTQKQTNIPNLHPKYFWEYRFDKLDWEEGCQMVIDRIIERGTAKDIGEVVRFYGRERVLHALRVEITFMTNIAISNAVSYFPELSQEQMLCYNNRKDKPYHYI